MTILILGATSAIAQAYARRRAGEGARFVLAGRRQDRLAAIAADLIACGAAAADPFVVDLTAIDGIEETARALRARFGEFDEALIAYGLLGEQVVSEQDPHAARVIGVTFELIGAAQSARTLRRFARAWSRTRRPSSTS